MDVVHQGLNEFDAALPVVSLSAPRIHLNKRRWRTRADDGREFGFDLVMPLRDGDTIFQDQAARYVIVQQPEPVLEVQLPPGAATAARLGWMIGNLHMNLEVVGEIARIIDDPAVRQLCERERLAYTAVERVFHPLSGGHSHQPEEPPPATAAAAS